MIINISPKLQLSVEELVRLAKAAEEFENFLKETPMGEFKPCAFYTPGLRDVRVIRKDCSYTACRVSRWSDILLDTHCPWWKFWGRYVGFEVYYPWALELTETISVRSVLERVLQEDPHAFGKYKRLYFWLARGLTVRIGKEEK